MKRIPLNDAVMTLLFASGRHSLITCGPTFGQQDTMQHGDSLLRATELALKLIRSEPRSVVEILIVRDCDGLVVAKVDRNPEPHAALRQRFS